MHEPYALVRNMSHPMSTVTLAHPIASSSHSVSDSMMRDLPVRQLYSLCQLLPFDDESLDGDQVCMESVAPGRSPL